ncbi:MAG: DUF5686 family protein [Saprospiraceae bacterium]
MAQTITVSGRVVDEDTKEGLAFCNVYFEGTTTGVSTDIDGYYTLTTEILADSLTASAIGYDLVRKVLAGAVNQEINFQLASSSLVLSEVVVVAGDNPANAVVRNIIKHKPTNRKEHLQRFQCEEYTKVELDLENISPKMRKSKLFKPFDFIFDNVDSLSDDKPFLPVYITEKISDLYYAKAEGKLVKSVQAERVSGIKNKTVVEFLNQIHKEFSVYDDWIYILEKPFASPFSDIGLHYYEYYLLDSSYINGQWSYKLKFKPKRKQENTFFGEFWVADTSFAIVRVDMRMSPGVNINLVKRVIIFQEFDFFQEEYWLPVKQKIVVDFRAAKQLPGMIGRKTVSLKKYNINEERAALRTLPVEQEYDLEEVAKDAAFWEEARHDKLSKNEKAIYAMVDSVKQVPLYKTYVDIMYTLVSGYKALGPVEVGPYFSLYSNNPVEGHRFKLGVWTSNSFSKRVRFGGYLAYGTHDQRFKFGGDLQWNLSKRPRIVFGLAYKDDVGLTSGNSEEIGEGNLFSGIYRRNILQKLIHVKEAKAFYERYWKKGWSTRVTLLQRQIDPYGGIDAEGRGFNYAYLPDAESLSVVDTTINATELILKARYALGEKFLDGQFVRTSLGTSHPVIELQYTAGLKGVFGGNYNYHKFTIAYKHYFYLNPIGWTAYRIKAGKILGDVPFLLAEVHTGNETYFYNDNVFNGMNRYEFASDTYASIFIEHHFDGFILNKIPLLRRLAWRTVLSFKAVIGTMTYNNRLSNRLNDFSADKLGSYTGFRTPSGEPYMETGIGIENIFKILRVDASWRLNYLDNPEASRFNVRAGFNFYF